MSASTNRPRQNGFTLVELLVVIVILSVLAALLLPALNGAVRRARDASVSAEMNQLAQALADFKSKYGDYPPSRIVLHENGDYSNVSSSNSLNTTTGTIRDINEGQLTQRSLFALRKFFPRVNFSTTGPVFAPASTTYYDFNGNGVLDGPHHLDGRECLAFFLGGIPINTGGSNFKQGMSGFGRNPSNPFTNTIVGNSMYSNNHNLPLFEFKGDRLVLIPDKIAGSRTPPTYIPGYVDASSTRTNPAFYAYFSAYGGAYDPNDVNVAETDDSSSPLTLNFKVNFPVYAPSSTTPAANAVSPPPNPYTNSPTVGTVSYQNPQSFQIISPGSDLLYGVGGQYTPTATDTMPVDLPNTIPSSKDVRTRERDNLTNFHNGRLD